MLTLKFVKYSRQAPYHNITCYYTADLFHVRHVEGKVEVRTIKEDSREEMFFFLESKEGDNLVYDVLFILGDNGTTIDTIRAPEV